MKTLTSLCGFLLISSAGFGANIRVQNFNDDGSQALVIAQITGPVPPLNSWCVAVGSFSTLTDAQISASAFTPGLLLGDFLPFGNTVSSPIRIGNSNAFGVGGFYAADVSAPINALSPLVGRPIYTIIGNGVTLAQSTGFIVVKDNDVFFADAPIAQANAFLFEPSSIVLLGTTGRTATNSLGVYPALTLPIPEPGIVALLLCAAIGFAKRRGRPAVGA